MIESKILSMKFYMIIWDIDEKILDSPTSQWRGEKESIEFLCLVIIKVTALMINTSLLAYHDLINIFSRLMVKYDHLKIS